MRIEGQVVSFVSRMPDKLELAIGVAGTATYGTITAFPDQAKENLSDLPLPVYGWVLENLSEPDLRRAAGALTILFGFITYDGVKRVLSKRKK